MSCEHRALSCSVVWAAAGVAMPTVAPSTRADNSASCPGCFICPNRRWLPVKPTSLDRNNLAGGQIVVGANHLELTGGDHVCQDRLLGLQPAHIGLHVRH